MKFLTALGFVFFSQVSSAADIIHFSEKITGLRNEQVVLVTMKVTFPNGNKATIEEKIVDGRIEVHLSLQNSIQRVLFEKRISNKPITKLPAADQKILSSREFYHALDSDDFIMFGTTKEFLVIRQDGVFFNASVGDPNAEMKDVTNLRVLKVGRSLTRLKYDLGNEAKELVTEAIFAEEEKKTAQNTDPDKVHLPTTVIPLEPSQVNLISAKAKIEFNTKGGADLVVKGKRQTITKNRVIQHSISGDKKEPADVAMLNQQDKVAVLVTEDEVLLVSHTGLVRQIEVDRAKLKKETVTINDITKSVLTPIFGTVESDGKVFAVLSFQYEHQPNQGNHSLGETYVWDIETNDLVRVAYRPLAFTQALTVDDGILTISGMDRKIDLRALKAENTFFQPMLPPKLKDESSSNFDAVKETESVFQDVAEDIRAGRKKVFSIDKESKEIVDHLTAAMAQKESPNPMLIAEAGTGKTALVYGFIEQIIKGNVVGVPRTVRVYELQVSTLEQGTMYTGMLSKRLKALEGAATQVPVIIFADEIHALRGSGTHKGNPDNDALSKLKPALMNGTFHMIGTSTEDEFNSAFGGDPALMRRFSLVKKPDPTKEQVLRAIDSWTERFGYPNLSMEMKEYLIEISNRHVVYGSQPSKATSLMDKAFARKVSLKLSNEAITKEDVIEALVANGVDKRLFEEKTAAQTLENLKKIWAEKMSGQEAARDAYYELESLRLSGLLNPDKPASLLVTGPRGAGKTRGAMVYAEATGRRFVKLNMADYSEGGVKEFQRRLAQEIFKDRFAVILFDEIEKAAPSVKNILLAILQDGKIKVPAKLSASADTSNSTETLDFTQTTVVLTSNAGEGFVMQAMRAGQVPQIGFKQTQEVKTDLTSKIQHSVMLEDGLKAAAMQDGLSSFLLDRVTLIAAALPSEREQFREMVDINLTQMLKDYTKSKGFEFEVINKDIFLDFAVAAYFRDGASNRIVENMLHKHFRKWIAIALAPLEQKNIKKALIEFNPQSGEAKVTALTTCEDALR